MSNSGAVTNNAINGSIIGTSTVTGIGTGHLSNVPAIYSMGSHTHSFGNIQAYTVIDITYNTSFKVSKGNEEVIEVKDNAIKLNETDKVDITELLSVFKYIKDDYPNLYADLILKGIIK